MREVDRQLSDALSRVRVEEDPSLPGGLGDLVHGLKHPGFVVGPDQRDECGVLAQGIDRRLRTDPSVRIYRRPGDLPAA